MAAMMSACGVLCSDCPAYLGGGKDSAHQAATAAAGKRIYGLNEMPKNISCGGYLGPDDELFHIRRTCEARLCCRLGTCAECPVERCSDLEMAQIVMGCGP